MGCLKSREAMTFEATLPKFKGICQHLWFHLKCINPTLEVQPG